MARASRSRVWVKPWMSSCWPAWSRFRVSQAVGPKQRVGCHPVECRNPRKGSHPAEPGGRPAPAATVPGQPCRRGVCRTSGALPGRSDTRDQQRSAHRQAVGVLDAVDLDEQQRGDPILQGDPVERFSCLDHVPEGFWGGGRFSFGNIQNLAGEEGIVDQIVEVAELLDGRVERPGNAAERVPRRHRLEQERPGRGRSLGKRVRAVGKALGSTPHRQLSRPSAQQCSTSLPVC
jgi:hypothetical protein